ncbi:MAG: hypothetical protein ACOC9J_02600 [Persicimonas sp.]
MNWSESYTVVLAFGDFNQWVNDNPLIFGGIIIGLLLLWLPFYKRDRKKKQDIVRDFAANHGLQARFPEYEYDASPFKRTVTCEVNGTYEGVPVRIAIGNDIQYVSLVTPRTSKWYLEFRATLRGWPRELTISREGLVSSVSKLVGKTDVEIGHEEFDRKFLVKGPEHLAHETLNASTIAALLKLESLGYDFIIDEGDLIISADPYPFEKAKLRRTTRSLVQAANRISGDPRSSF